MGGEGRGGGGKVVYYIYCFLFYLFHLCCFQYVAVLRLAFPAGSLVYMVCALM